MAALRSRADHTLAKPPTMADQPPCRHSACCAYTLMCCALLYVSVLHAQTWGRLFLADGAIVCVAPCCAYTLMCCALLYVFVLHAQTWERLFLTDGALVCVAPCCAYTLM
jgi:hypothetical protein